MPPSHLRTGDQKRLRRGPVCKIWPRSEAGELRARPRPQEVGPGLRTFRSIPISCLQKDRTDDSHFHTGLGDRVHDCLAAALVVMRLEELGSFCARAFKIALGLRVQRRSLECRIKLGQAGGAIREGGPGETDAGDSSQSDGLWISEIHCSVLLWVH